MKKNKDEEIEIDLKKIDWKFVIIIIGLIGIMTVILIPKIEVNVTENVNEWECDCNCNCEYEEREIKAEVNSTSYWNWSEINYINITPDWYFINVNSSNWPYRFFNISNNELFPTTGWHDDCMWCMNINKNIS